MATVIPLYPERITMTLEEFLALPEQDEQGNHFELNEGELITLSPTGYPHGRRVGKISSYLDHLLDEATYDVVVGEVGIILKLDPGATVRGMDVAVMYRRDAPARGMVRTPPLLIVEVISPGNDPVDLEKKRRQYQQFGVPEIWFVYQDTRCVYVYRDDKPNFFIAEAPFYSSSLGIEIDTRELFR